MFRVVLALVFVTATAPAFAEQAADSAVVTQQQKPAQQAPKRDCERQQGEGVS
jgi:Ni/Co efflux regulator RcnB